MYISASWHCGASGFVFSDKMWSNLSFCSIICSALHLPQKHQRRRITTEREPGEPERENLTVGEAHLQWDSITEKNHSWGAREQGNQPHGFEAMTEGLYGCL